MVYTFFVSVQYGKIVNTFLYQCNIAPLSVSMTIWNFTQKVSKWYWNISCWTQNECIYNLHAKFWPSFFLFGSRKLAVSNNDHAHIHNQYLAIRGRSFPYCFWPSLSSCLEFLSALSWQPCSLSGSACLHTCCRLSQENQSGHALPIRQKLSSPCQSTNIMKTKHFFQTFLSKPMISCVLTPRHWVKVIFDNR